MATNEEMETLILRAFHELDIKPGECLFVNSLQERIVNRAGHPAEEFRSGLRRLVDKGLLTYDDKKPDLYWLPRDRNI